MSQFNPLKESLLVAGSMCCLGLTGVEAQAAPRIKTQPTSQPNIVVIMTDQQTATAMSCAGNPYVKTPNIDQIAQDGVRFTRAYCPFPLSGPCRASLVTGRMPFEVGAFANDIRPYEEDMAQGIGHRMSDAGYECLYAGKWHVPEINIPEQGTGFKRVATLNDTLLVDACHRAFKEYDRKKPLFLVASFLNPHEICEYGRFESLKYGELEPFQTEDCPNLPRNFMPSTYQAEAMKLEQRLAPRYHDNYTYTEDDWRRYIYAYYRLVERVDVEIGRLIDLLKAQNLYDNSLIVFLSDHGDGVAAHGWNQKWALYEECVNVPLLVKAPKGQGLQGVVKEDALSNVGLDLYATVCDYAGVEIDPKRYLGKSWRGVVERNQASLHEEVFVETTLSSVNMRGWTLVGKRYKYVLYQWGRNREQLYDMTNDRGEMLNLAVDRQYREVVAEMRQKMYEWGLRIGDKKLIRNLKPFVKTTK